MVVKSIMDSYDDGYSYSNGLKIFIDDKSVFTVFEGEPEDNTLGRNYNDCYKIPELMRLAFEAGKRGEEISFKTEEVESK